MPRFREDSSWSPSETAEGLFHRGARPFVLKVAQSFLVIIVAIYLTKLAVLAMGMNEGYGNQFVSIATFLVDMAMMLVTMDSLLVVSSRRPKAWKKAVRAAMLLVIFNLIAWYGNDPLSASSLVVMNPLSP